MIIPSGSAAFAIDTDGKVLLVCTEEDDLKLFIEDDFGSPHEFTLGKGQAAFDKLVSKVTQLSSFTGD